jgi:hypothetical protein
VGGNTGGAGAPSIGIGLGDDVAVTIRCFVRARWRRAILAGLFPIMVRHHMMIMIPYEFTEMNISRGGE